MDNKHWIIDQDFSSVNSIAKVLVPWVEISLETWIQIEENQNWWTLQQINALNEFLALSEFSKDRLRTELEIIYTNKQKEGRIEINLFEDIFTSIEWQNSQICIPQHYDSENNYVLLLPETKCKLVDSDYTLELEVLFTNGHIELIQEMSGLWNRIEWFEDYIKRKKLIL